MIRRTVSAVALVAETGLRAAHLTEATVAVEHDWQAVIHGIAHPETVFAAFVIADAAVRLAAWCLRGASDAIKARRERRERRAAKEPAATPDSSEVVPGP